MSRKERSEADQRNEIRRQVMDNSVANFSYIFMNVAATIIACYGLLADSTAVVIGAMLIAALLGPITGLALGLVDGNRRLLRIAGTSEIIGVIVVLATAFIIGSIHNEIPTGKEIASRTAPNIMDLIIALAGGAAGTYAATKPQISASLIGVAISTALVPPLATFAMLSARGQYELGFGGFMLFFANFVAIQFASSVVFWLSGFHNLINKDETKYKQLVLRGTLSFGLLLILAGVLGINFFQMANKEKFEQNVREQLTKAVTDYPTTSVSEVYFQKKDSKNIVTAVLRTPRVITKDQVGEVERKLPQLGSDETELHVRSVLTTETTRDGNIDPKSKDNLDLSTDQNKE